MRSGDLAASVGVDCKVYLLDEGIALSAVDLLSVGTDCSLQSLSEICFGNQTGFRAFKHVENLGHNWVVLDGDVLFLEEGLCFDCV